MCLVHKVFIACTLHKYDYMYIFKKFVFKKIENTIQYFFFILICALLQGILNLCINNILILY